MNPLTWRGRTAAIILGLSMVVGAGGSQVAAVQFGTVVVPSTTNAVADSYIVTLRDTVARDEVAATARRLVHRYGGSLGHVYRTVLRGFSLRTSLDRARRLAAHPSVERVEQNVAGEVTAGHRQDNPPSWGLDRIDQSQHPLDNIHRYPNQAPSVVVYVLDSGIRTSHQDFGGRAIFGTSTVPGGGNYDCHDHGTHVAGTIGGSSYGVAPSVLLISVQVVTCDANRRVTADNLIAGLDWIATHLLFLRTEVGGLWPAVGNISLMVGAGSQTAAETALRNSITSGITWVVAAGNGNSGSCTSPGRVAEAITVAATDRNDARWSVNANLGSNYGSCVDVFAPGADITSLSDASDTATAVQSGTSMAAPHVAGAAAMILHDHPTWTPEQVRDEIVNTATAGVVTGAGTGSPNLLLDAWPGPIVAAGICESLRRSIRCYASSTGSAIATVSWQVNGMDRSWTNRLVSFGCSPGTSYTVRPLITDANGLTDYRVESVVCTDHNR